MTTTSPQLDRRFSLAPRILAVNVFAILALTGSIFYLDSFRERLLEQRRAEMRMQAVLIGSFMGEAPAARLPAIAARFGRIGAVRLRVYDRDGTRVADSWDATGPTFELRDPKLDPFRRDVARFLDRVIEAVGSFPRLADYAEPAVDARPAWAEVVAASARGRAADHHGLPHDHGQRRAAEHHDRAGRSSVGHRKSGQHDRAGHTGWGRHRVCRAAHQPEPFRSDHRAGSGALVHRHQ